MRRREPAIRMCVGCRRKDDRDALVRFVLAGDPPKLVADVARRARGRGASLHPSRACLSAAVRAGAFRRALKTDASLRLDADELARNACAQYALHMDRLL